MARPTLSDVFGPGTVALNPGPFEVPSEGLFIPLSALGYEFTPFPFPPDAQVLFMRLMMVAAQAINESNRASNRADVVVTVSYADYDQIFDPPGSTALVRRDVFSVIAYDEQPAVSFDPDSLAP